MKAVINEKGTPVKPKYPYIGKFTHPNEETCIVIFSGEDRGTVLYSSSDRLWSICEFRNNWGEHSFTPFTGSITLSND